MTRRFVSAVGVVIATVAAALLTTLGGCSDALNWREFAWPEGEFKVLFPARPDREVGQVTIGGVPLSMTLIRVRVEGIAFAAGYAELPMTLDAAGQSKLLDDAVQIFVTNVAAAKPEIKTIGVSGHPAREFRATGQPDGKSRTVIGRVAVSDKRYYQVIAVVPTERANEPDLQLFVESLTIDRTSR